MNDPRLIPQSAILAGTLHALDRSRQYTEPEPREVLRAANEAWTRIRVVEKETREENARLRGAVRRYKLRNVVLTSIITGLACEGLRVVGEMLAHFAH